jgi:hypothetical protein
VCSGQGDFENGRKLFSNSTVLSLRGRDFPSSGGRFSACSSFDMFHFRPVPLSARSTSIASNLHKGFMENGRRYRTLRNSENFSPADEQQFDTYETDISLLCS